MLLFFIQIQLFTMLLCTLANVSFSATGIYGKTETSIATDSTDTIARYHTLRLRTLYGSNLLFLGRQSNRKYPFTSAFLSYKTASGLWTSATAFHIIDFIPAIAETDVSTGWDFKLSKRTDVSLNYSHFFYSPDNPIVKSVISDDIQFSIGYDWKLFYTYIAGDYLFGNLDDYYLSFVNDRYFEKELFKGNHLITIDPLIGVYLGPQKFSSKYQNKISGGKGSSSKGKNTINTNAATDVASSVFSVIYYQVSLPVAYYIGRWGLKLNTFYAVPVNNLEGDYSSAQLNYTLSLQYKIRFLKGKK